MNVTKKIVEHRALKVARDVLKRGWNPIPVVIPCHRVIGAGGALTGYAGGLDRKVALLELEGSLLPG